MQSRVFSIGNGVLWAEAGVGVAATQAIVDVSYGAQALALLRQGMDAEQVVKTIWERDLDPRPKDWSKEGRQFAVVDAKGNVYAHTGPKTTPWAGNTAPSFVCRWTTVDEDDGLQPGLVGVIDCEDLEDAWLQEELAGFQNRRPSNSSAVIGSLHEWNSPTGGGAYSEAARAGHLLADY